MQKQHFTYVLAALVLGTFTQTHSVTIKNGLTVPIYYVHSHHEKKCKKVEAGDSFTLKEYIDTGFLKSAISHIPILNSKSIEVYPPKTWIARRPNTKKDTFYNYLYIGGEDATDSYITNRSAWDDGKSTSYSFDISGYYYLTSYFKTSIHNKHHHAKTKIKVSYSYDPTVSRPHYDAPSTPDKGEGGGTATITTDSENHLILTTP